MDNANLNHLLLSLDDKQMWIKQWGHPDLPPEQGEQVFDAPKLTVGFGRNPYRVKIGDILIVYRIKVAKVMFIGEVISAPTYITDEEVKKNPLLEKWRWNIETRNLTPVFGTQWAKHSLKPFTLVATYNRLNPQDKVNLGSLNWGGGVLEISKGFGKFIINEIIGIAGEGVSNEEAHRSASESASELIIEEIEPTEELINSGAGFGNPETNRMVERAAVSYVTDWYEARGWKVKSVESEKRGYDLLCSKGTENEHVEVKGVQGGSPSFIVTANEVKQARNDSEFVVCVVTSALSESPKMHRLRAEEFINGYDLLPLAYRANPK